MKPIYDQILIKRIDSEEVSSGGIIIPDMAKEKAQQGKVISVGNGHRLPDGGLAPLIVRPGDTVLFAKYSGTEIEFKNEEFLILAEDEILCISSREEDALPQSKL